MLYVYKKTRPLGPSAVRFCPPTLTFKCQQDDSARNKPPFHIEQDHIHRNNSLREFSISWEELIERIIFTELPGKHYVYLMMILRNKLL